MGEFNLPELEAMKRQMDAMQEVLLRIASRIEDEPRDAWTTEDVARHYGVTTKTVRAHAKAGKLPFRRVGHKMAFDPEALPDELTKSLR